MISEQDDPPEYGQKFGDFIDYRYRSLCDVTMQIKYLPSSAAVRKVSPSGEPYHRLHFELGVQFLTTIEFKVMVDGKVVGCAMADYV